MARAAAPHNGSDAQAVVCPSCNTRIKRGRTTCLRCGEPLPEVDAGAEDARRSRTVLVLVAGSLTLATGLVVAVAGRRPPATLPAASPQPTAQARPQPPPPAQQTAPPDARRRPAPPRFADEAAVATWEYDRGDLEAALRRFRDAVGRNPRDAESLSNLGQVLVRLHRAQEALPLLQRAIELTPDHWGYRFNLARAFGELNQWAEAVAQYREAARLFPDDYATQFNLARALYKQGDAAAAVPEYQKAIALQPEDPTFHTALAVAYERLNRRNDAAAEYAQYLELAPDAPDVDKVRARIAQLLPPRSARRPAAPPPVPPSAPR